ncbi:MAG TPA: hypothetical protein VFH48_01155 [Chloroflexota bacterium]|nr:hypothetical protein [Chloroflexota bacterium]
MNRDHQREHRTPEALSADELAAQTAVDLPDREAMSTIGHGFGHGIDNFAMPINEAEAANINSTSSIAAADADQTVIIYQTSDE